MTALSPGLQPRPHPQQLPVSPWRQRLVPAGTQSSKLVTPPTLLPRRPGSTLPAPLLTLVCRHDPPTARGGCLTALILGASSSTPAALSSSLTWSQKTRKTRSAGPLRSTPRQLLEGPSVGWVTSTPMFTSSESWRLGVHGQGPAGRAGFGEDAS